MMVPQSRSNFETKCRSITLFSKFRIVQTRNAHAGLGERLRSVALRCVMLTLALVGAALPAELVLQHHAQGWFFHELRVLRAVQFMPRVRVATHALKTGV